MKYNSDIDASYSASSLVLDSPHNNLDGGPSTVATPDQLGISITKSVMGWQYPHDGTLSSNGGLMGLNKAANDWIGMYGMPFIFVVNGQQILLPPVIKSGGTAVPYLPDGLTVRWAQSFMGVTIPSDMISPVSSNGKLKLSPVLMNSAKNSFPEKTSVAGDSTANFLLNSGKESVVKGGIYLCLLMAAMECLIYSYSSYPWGNGYNDLSQAIIEKRTYDDFLIFPYQKGTFLSSVVHAIAPVFTVVGAPVASIIGGKEAGQATAAIGTKLSQVGSGSGYKTTVDPSQSTQLAPSSTPTGAITIAPTSSSPNILLIVGAILVVIIVIIIAKSSS